MMTETDRTEYRHQWLDKFLKGGKRNPRPEMIERISMWDDDKRVSPAIDLSRDIFKRVTKFLDKGGNLKDAFDILVGQVNTDFLRKFAIDKLGLVDPVN